MVKLLQLVRTDLERERKSRNGLKELSHSMNTPENPNIADKLYHVSYNAEVVLRRSEILKQFYQNFVDTLNVNIPGRCQVQTTIRSS